jgi:hypothetical protein
MGPSDACLITARNIRRERTGLHADIGVFLFEDPPRLIGRDIFNVGRHEELVRLCRAVHRRLPPLAKEAYLLESLESDLMYFCLWLDTQWEGQQFQVDAYTHAEAPSGPTFILHPYILDGGGSILFAPRESAKSYVCILFAGAITNGLQEPWRCTQRPVLYVNLERDPVSLKRRDYAAARVLGLKSTGITWLHARGYGMEAVARQVKAMATPETVVIYDSISRMGVGGLNDDVTANRSSDLANWASRTWLAIGHTPRADASHLFGSTHFENASDVLIRMTKDTKDEEMGIGLQVTKANDFKKPAMQIHALTFDDIGLLSMRSSNSKQFPGLLGKADESTSGRITRIVDVLRIAGSGSATDVSEATGISRQACSSIMANTPEHFQLYQREGRTVIYKLANI